MCRSEGLGCILLVVGVGCKVSSRVAAGEVFERFKSKMFEHMPPVPRTCLSESIQCVWKHLGGKCVNIFV